jgi:hypothetical protein
MPIFNLNVTEEPNGLVNLDFVFPDQSIRKTVSLPGIRLLAHDLAFLSSRLTPDQLQDLKPQILDIYAKCLISRN